MYVIVDGYAYIVIEDTGYKVDFDVLGQMQVSGDDTISITNQEKFTYDEMYKKMNFAASIDTQRKNLISQSATETELNHFYENVKNAIKKDKFDKITYDSVLEIEGRLDDCIITFDANGGTGSMAEVRKEVGDEYALPPCIFIAPENKRFANWQIGSTDYDIGDKITLSESITVKAIWESIPIYTLSFDANGGSGTMQDITVDEGESVILPECTFIAPENKEFSSWQINDETYNTGDEYTPDDDVTVYALYTDITTSEEES